jgi:peptide-methionine (S)-S-oxide reductase
MMHRLPSYPAVAILSLLLPLVFLGACGSTHANVALPDPAVDDSLAAASAPQSTVFAGGCFWGIQAVFEHVKGVTQATAGYSGGSADTAQYETVSTGTTGHAESVRVVYDPSHITYGQLLRIFFSVHDPTQLNRQGPDSGTQYRTAIFFANENQQRIATAYIDQLSHSGIFSNHIVTQVVPLKAFYPAEAYHQDYAFTHRDNPYIVINDLPKVAYLHQQFPSLYVEKR